MDATYLRTLSERCLRAARTCFDLSASQELREIGEELARKAAELDKTSARVGGHS
jgi:hypothetical protein